MAFMGVIGFLLLCIMMTYKFNEKFVTVFPVCIGIWIFVIYLLAFFQKIYWIDYFGSLLLLFFLFYITKNKICERKNLIMCNSTLLLVIVYFFLWLINKNRVSWGGDDLGVWAIEVKSIFHVNGFADKYKNVSLGYGDYHPGQMLFEWWICHLGGEKFNEGLMYVGYEFLYASFLVPMLRVFDNEKFKRIPIYIGTFFIAILLLPSCVDILSYNFLSVELLMSVVYANLLYLAFIEDENKLFYCTKITVYLFLLMLLKNTGVIYVLLFWILIFALSYKNKQIKYYLNRKSLLYIVLLSGIPILIWKIYCKLWDRKNYFLAIGENLLKDVIDKSFYFSADAKELLNSFIKSLFVEPLHSDKTIFLDITVILCIMLTILLIFFTFKKDKVRRNIFLIHYLGSVIVLLLGVLFMHIFIFRELQYIYTSNMIYSISRYVEPIFLGGIVAAFMVIVNDCINLKRRKRDMLVIIIFVFLCANYSTLYNQIINYSPIKEAVIAERIEVSNQNKELLDEINEKQIEGRILYVVNNTEYFDSMAQRRFSYMASPASIIYQFVDISTVDKNRNYSDILWMINNNNCQYIFFKGIPKEYMELFDFNNKNSIDNELLNIERSLTGEIYFSAIN